MNTNRASAIVDTDFEDIKNDMVRSGAIESTITLSHWDEVHDWFETTIGEAEDL
jgi:hypothetical protein